MLSRGRLRAAVALSGPAFVASVAYVDPGNFVTNFAGGGRYGYQLLWVVVLASVLAILVQYLASKVGLATGRSLPAVCADVLPRQVNLLLWIQAELVAVATDLAEFVGAALGLHLLFGIGLFPAGLITAAVAFLVLGLRQRGHRGFEIAIIVTMVLVAAGFGYLFVRAGHQDFAAVARGLVPRLRQGELGVGVGIVGATVMPHVIYLHSALQAGRVGASTPAQRQVLLTHNRWDCVVGLGAAGVVNAAMLCVAAAVPGLSGSAGDLVASHDALAANVGTVAGIAFAVALVAAGLGSASVATYAGQVVMEGFMNWRIPLLLRRGVTMLPSLVVLALTDSVGGPLLISQIALAFGIPFALVPMIIVTRRADVMGDMVNRRATTIVVSVATGLVIALNVYLLIDIIT
ncbi:MAG TPA: Nramp family divalent metal transporter [Pseudonocardiaceae bacterium]